jgi:hypothetical protein
MQLYILVWKTLQLKLTRAGRACALHLSRHAHRLLEVAIAIIIVLILALDL